MIHRRALLFSAMASHAAWVSGPRPGCQTNAYRVNPSNFDELLAVLDKLKAYGYRGFETGFRNVQGRFASAMETRKEIEKREMEFIGCHIFLLQYDAATLLAPADLVESIINGAPALGAHRLILSGASAGKDRAAMERKAKALNAYGRMCRQNKLKLAYHN
ncbi:MAG: TIM barrel protein, partial [Candidatus Solibacter usitatus]|nr:TIM barrel protein [Candidatus Solibacter usitatus]